MGIEEIGLLNLMAYVDLFDFPLTSAEIEKYLISSSPVPPLHLAEALERLTAAGLLSRHPQGFYHFPEKDWSVARRQERENFSRKLFPQAQRLARFLAFLPWVKLIAVTGSLASFNSFAGDDIDFLVVTAHRRLWLTRFFVFLIFKLFGIKKGQKRPRVENAVCINVWMDEKNLTITGEDQDLLIAFDLARSRVLVDKDGVWQKLLLTNPWVGEYLPNFYRPSLKREKMEAQRKAGRRWPFLIPSWCFFVPKLLLKTLFDLSELLVYDWQLRLIEKNFPQNPHIKESPYRLWQHPTNTRGAILTRYRKNLQKRLALVENSLACPSQFETL